MGIIDLYLLSFEVRIRDHNSNATFVIIIFFLFVFLQENCKNYIKSLLLSRTVIYM